MLYTKTVGESLIKLFHKRVAGGWCTWKQLRLQKGSSSGLAPRGYLQLPRCEQGSSNLVCPVEAGKWFILPWSWHQETCSVAQMYVSDTTEDSLECESTLDVCPPQARYPTGLCVASAADVDSCQYLEKGRCYASCKEKHGKAQSNETVALLQVNPDPAGPRAQGCTSANTQYTLLRWSQQHHLQQYIKAQKEQPVYSNFTRCD